MRFFNFSWLIFLIISTILIYNKNLLCRPISVFEKQLIFIAVSCVWVISADIDFVNLLRNCIIKIMARKKLRWSYHVDVFKANLLVSKMGLKLHDFPSMGNGNSKFHGFPWFSILWWPSGFSRICQDAWKSCHSNHQLRRRHRTGVLILRSVWHHRRLPPEILIVYRVAI